jgi:DNA-binding GntR family transcriptional regulator
MSRKSASAQKTKKEIMVEILRDAILSGELQPGERLLQEELAERFHVSPTPIREALQQLIAEGALSHSPYKGVQVAEVKLEDVSEIYLIRSVVEGLATRMAIPNLKISDVQRLHVIQNELRAHVEKDEHKPVLELNREFHMLIYRVADMPQLFQMIKTLWIKTPWDTLFVIPNRTKMMLAEHQLIIDAIDQGNADRAGEYMREHIEQVNNVLVEYLRTNH